MDKLQELKKVIDEGYNWYFKNTDGHCKSSEGWIEVQRLSGTYFERRDKEMKDKSYNVFVYSYVFCEKGRRVEFDGETEDEALQKAIDYFKRVISISMNKKGGSQ